jgi:hypothetical protein
MRGIERGTKPMSDYRFQIVKRTEAHTGNEILCLHVMIDSNSLEEIAHTYIPLDDIEMAMKRYRGTGDWDKLTEAQKTQVDNLRRHIADFLIAETEAFYKICPELQLMWSFECNPLIRANQSGLQEV